MKFITYSTLKEAISEFKGDIERLVVVEKHVDYSEGLIFQHLQQDAFTRSYSSFISRFGMLSELFLLDHFVEQLEKDGYDVIFLGSCQPVLDKFQRYSQPLHIENFRVPNGGSLYPFQEFALNKAISRAGEKRPEDRLFFFGFGTGTGKSLISAAGAQELFNQGKIDLVIAFTLRKLKINLCRNFNSTTNLRAVVIDGEKKKRAEEYAAGDFDVLVTNYEKCHFDFDEMLRLVRGKRVLWVMDETQKVLQGEGRPTLARKGLDKLIKASTSIVWPMSASVVSQTPFRYRDVFSLHGSPRKNILGPKYVFENTYLESKFENTYYNRNGGRFTKTFITWDQDKLQEIRHRVSPFVQSVRKTDPGVRDIFKGMQTVVHPIQMSDKDRQLYEVVEKMAKDAAREGFSITEHVQVLRYVCNTPEVLLYSESQLAKELVADYPKLITSDNSSKLEVFLDQVESIAEAGDKVVAFTQYTNLTLFTLKEHLQKRGIKFVTHFGAGMTDKEAQKAQDDFKNNDDITLFMSSDAGAYGLNFQEARFVINYDIPYSYDTLMQRGDRVNRADSYLDGLTSYVYVTDDSVEENIWKINNQRRRLAEVTQGARESLNSGKSALDIVAQEDDESSLMNKFALLGEDSFTANMMN